MKNYKFKLAFFALIFSISSANAMKRAFEDVEESSYKHESPIKRLRYEEPKAIHTTTTTTDSFQLAETEESSQENNNHANNLQKLPTELWQELIIPGLIEKNNYYQTLRNLFHFSRTSKLFQGLLHNNPSFIAKLINTLAITFQATPQTIIDDLTNKIGIYSAKTNYDQLITSYYLINQLIKAINEDNLERVKVLILLLGANPNLPNKNEITALQFAEDAGKTKIIKHFKLNNDLIEAVKQNNVALAIELIKSGAQITAKDHNNRSILEIAKENNFTKLVNHLERAISIHTAINPDARTRTKRKLF